MLFLVTSRTSQSTRGLLLLQALSYYTPLVALGNAHNIPPTHKYDRIIIMIIMKFSTVINTIQENRMCYVLVLHCCCILLSFNNRDGFFILLTSPQHLILMSPLWTGSIIRILIYQMN